MSQYTYTNNPGALLFVRNAADFVVRLDNDETIAGVSIASSGQAISLPGTWLPDEKGCVTFRIREIAEGLFIGQIKPTDERLEQPEIHLGVVVQRYDSQTTHSVSLPWVKGGYDPDVPNLGSEIPHRWWTWRGSRIKTCTWGKEYLYCLVPDGMLLNVFVSLLMDNGTVCPFTLRSATYTKDSIARIDVSYGRIRDVADRWGFEMRDIVSWTVYGSIGKRQLPVISFEADKDSIRWKGFLFRNSLGVFDTIYARGKSVDKISYEHTVFRSGYIEQEQAVNTVRQCESFTGWLESKSERELWAEFIESDERYLLTRDGIIKPIIVDSVNSDLEEHADSGLSFVWHLAKVRQGGGYGLNENGDSSSRGSSASASGSGASSGSDDRPGPEPELPDQDEPSNSSGQDDTPIILDVPAPASQMLPVADWKDWSYFSINENILNKAREHYLSGGNIYFYVTLDAYRVASIMYLDSDVEKWSCETFDVYIDHSRQKVTTVGREPGSDAYDFEESGESS
ncbi:MAG: hypothetical protein IJU13_04185 [Bacteroidales bacterium]|nr:hypothetical protein [Bacteroidales bacterium]